MKVILLQLFAPLCSSALCASHCDEGIGKLLKEIVFKVVSCVFLGPINREMRNLISSLKNHNEQLKVEVQRYKRRLREAATEITKVSWL